MGSRLHRELPARVLLRVLQDSRIDVVPPCVVTDEEVARAMDVYDHALGAVEKELDR